MSKLQPHFKPERMPMHWAYFMLYEAGLIAGLWLHGDPRLTLVLMVITMPLGLIGYIPYKYFNEDLRQLAHYVVAAGAVAWSIYRFSHRPPLDVLLIEMFSVKGLSFAFTCHRRGYYYMLMIGIVLTLYGSVVPPRELYIIIMPVAFVLAIMLLYQTRAAALANDAELPTKGSLSFFNVPWFLVHVASVIFLWVLLVVLFPAPSWQTPGFIPTSTDHRNMHAPPPRMDDWFSAERQRAERDARRQGNLRTPTELSPEGTIKVQSDVWMPNMSQDGGGGPPGEDLVMRVRSPLKLYWLGRLYDQYDGRVWHSTPSMQLQRVRIPEHADLAFKTVRQQFYIEKWVSKYLFSSYLRHGLLISGSAEIPMRHHFATMQVTNPDLPLPVPYSYEVRSLIDYHLGNISGDEGLPGWYEQKPYTDYLALPDDIVDSRLARLATNLTAGKSTDLSKAYALRDWFREHFEYSLEAPKPPEDREPVDYFVYTLRKGHCEYFASSLTVMARLAGLPARVATGFSPGNYNVLSGMFEVYEYHAHAWTQVFIRGTGWITLDGTPPGSMPTRSRTSPFMIGNLRDPFTDDWRISSPELGSDTQSYLRQQIAAAQAERRDVRTQSAGRASPSHGGDESDTQALSDALRAEMERARRVSNMHGGTMLETFAINFKLLLQRAWSAIKSTADVAARLLFNRYALVVLVILLLVRHYYPIWRRKRRRRQQLRQCRKWYEAAESCADQRPEKSIVYGFNSARLLLELAGFHKDILKELTDYANQDIEPELREPSAAIFDAYEKVSYRPEQPSPAEARLVCQHMDALHQALVPRLQNAAGDGTSA